MRPQGWAFPPIQRPHAHVDVCRPIIQWPCQFLWSLRPCMPLLLLWQGIDLVKGSKKSKSAEECCAKHPDTIPDQPDGFCLNVDLVCIYEEQRFYHYNTLWPKNGSLLFGCACGCDNVETQFLEWGMVPSSPKSYATVEECCNENGCDFWGDHCPPQPSSTSSVDADNSTLWHNFDESEIEGMSFSVSLSPWFISKMKDYWIGEW